MSKVDLSKIANALRKKYGSTTVGEELPDASEFVSTGNLAFDLIADGGVPFGFSTELLGLSQSGKSLFIQQIIANAQRDYDAIGVLVDRENAYSKSRGAQLGINNDNLILAPPQDTPDVPSGFNFLIDTINNTRKEYPDVYIVLAIDSIAAFDQDTDLDKSNTPRRAKALHAAFRKFLPYLDSKVMLLVANHVTYKVGVMFGDPRTSASGESVKYYNHVRFALEDKRKVVDTDRGNEVVGNWIGVEVIKTRLGPCYRTCYLRHLYKTGIDYYSGYARLLADRGYLIPKNKQEFKSFKQSTLSYGDSTVNEHNMEQVVKQSPELLFDAYPPYYSEEEKGESKEKEKKAKK